MTQEEAKKHLSYDPITGEFTKLSGRKKGPYAGFKSTMGYRKININGHEYFLHRLAFLLMTGSIPEQVDHINMNKEDNRWENLRPTNNSLNQTNTVSRSKSGFKGVRQRKSGKWEAQVDIQEKGKRRTVYLGSYTDKETAIKKVEEYSKNRYGEHWRSS